MLGETYIWNTEYQNSDYNFLWRMNLTTDSALTINQQGLLCPITDTNYCFIDIDTITVFSYDFLQISQNNSRSRLLLLFGYEMAYQNPSAGHHLIFMSTNQTIPG